MSTCGLLQLPKVEAKKKKMVIELLFANMLVVTRCLGITVP